jgi:hypothetical protein
VNLVPATSGYCWRRAIRRSFNPIKLANSIYETYETIVDACCAA